MSKKENNKGTEQTPKTDGISRRVAIRKMGYAAFAGSTMFLLLNNPTKVHAQSPDPDNPGDPGGGDFPGDKSEDKNYGDYDWD